MKDYKALVPITHDGKGIKVGGKLSLEDDQAEQLLGVNAIEQISKTDSKKADAEAEAAKKAEAEAAEKAAAEKAAADAAAAAGAGN